MKISQFCKRFNLPLTTIRYYILSGLLVPHKQNSQFLFTESDVKEMEMILELKNLHFTTDEIKQFLQVIRMYHAGDDTIHKQLFALYASKKAQLEDEIKQYTASIDALYAKLEQCRSMQKGGKFTGGIPLTFSANLACPTCGGAFRMSEIQIYDNQIYQGTMRCPCGYHAEIEDGVILTNPSLIHLGVTTQAPLDYYTSSAFHVMHYREVSPQNADFVFFQYMHDISSEVTALIHKAYSWINATISQHNPASRIILVPDLASHFLYKHIDSPCFKDAYIIVSGFSKRNIQSIKSHIDQLAPDLQIIYIANTIYELPIKKKSIDLWIDANSSYNFSFFHDFSLYEKIEDYMTDTAHVVGYTKYYSKNSLSHKNIRHLYPYSLHHNSFISTFYENMKRFHWDLLLEEEFGYATSPGTYYEYHAKGEHHHYHGFYAEKYPTPVS